MMKNLPYILYLFFAAYSLPVFADFKTLYINDVSQIIYCDSSYNKIGEPIDDIKIGASVEEVGDSVDVQMLQPCFTWVPWWKSNVYPADEHYKWFEEAAGYKHGKGGLAGYMTAGGDIVAAFIKSCRECGSSPFISFRLNDYHHKEDADWLIEKIADKNKFKDVSPSSEFTSSCLSKFYLNNRQWWIGPEPEIPPQGRFAYLKDRNYRTQLRKARTMDWAVPEVREHVFSLIKELCDNYDIDGLELDFMRSAPFFGKDTPMPVRSSIMIDFVSRVRKALDRNALDKTRTLCVRVPFRTDEYLAVGIDLPAFVNAGVDMVNISCNYYTEQQCDIAEICNLIPTTPVYMEFTDLSQTVITPTQQRISRRLTDEQIYTLAHLAYSRGASGISAFNFAYYRRNESGRGYEPPFHVFKIIRDKELVATQPQHYFLSSKDADGNNIKGLYAAGKSKEIKIYMAKPSNGWKNTAKLRIQSTGLIDCAVEFNGAKLSYTKDKSCPYDNPYTDVCGDEEINAWLIPPDVLRNGINTIKLTPQRKADVSYIDIFAN